MRPHGSEDVATSVLVSAILSHLGEEGFTAISLEDSVANQQPVVFCIALAKLHFCGQTCSKMQPTGLER